MKAKLLSMSSPTSPPNRKALILVALASAILTTLLYPVGMFAIAEFLPPPTPTLSEQAIVSLYQNQRNSIIAGLSMAFVGTGFMLPLCLIGSVFMAEVEIRNGQLPFFASLQALCALATVLFTVLPNLVWMTAAFRPDRSPELTYLLHDLGWIMWATPSWGFCLQLVCAAIVGLQDKSDSPFMPRWLSYLAIWVAVGVMPTPLVPFFMQGPFAWNGLFSFWIAFFSPIFWIALLSFIIIRNIRLNPALYWGEPTSSTTCASQS